MLPPRVFQLLRDAITPVVGELRPILDDVSVDLDAISSPQRPNAARAEEILRWARAGGPRRIELLLGALEGEFAGNPTMRAAIDASRAHLACVAAAVTSVFTVRWIEGDAFADREDLRHYLLHEFSSVQHPYRVVVINGAAQTGKSYLWNFIRHAAGSLYVETVLIDLETAPDITLTELFTEIVRETGRKDKPMCVLDTTATAVRQARAAVSQLVGWHKEGEALSEPPLWIVIDHLDKIWPPEDPAVAHFIQGLMQAAAQRRARGLRLLLLGAPPEAIGSGLENALEPKRIDPITPGDLIDWLRDELGDPNVDMTHLDSEARVVHSGGPRQLHTRLRKCFEQLRGPRRGTL